MNKVYDNNDFGNFLKKDSLINATSNSKEFSLRARNVNCIVKSFDYWFIVNIDMRYKQSDIVLNTDICYYKCVGWRVGRFNS